MKCTCWFILMLYLSTRVSDGCEVANNVMNCTNMKLDDCPPINNSITALILDMNFLTNLTSQSCLEWFHLEELSVANNQLTVVSNFSQFSRLTKLNLKRNQLSTIQIYANTLTNIDCSYNVLSTVQISRMSQLKYLILDHNSIDRNDFNDLIKTLHHSPIISVLNVSYNRINALPVEFMSYSPELLTCLNLAGNSMTELDFILFNRNIHHGFSLDLSDNQITSFSLKAPIYIGLLSFSKNSLSKIDVTKLNYFQGLKSLDLSWNPLNCLCNESASFIEWIHEKIDILSNKNQTFCKFPSNQLLVSVLCSSTSTVTTKMTTKPSSSTNSVTSTTKKTVVTTVTTSRTMTSGSASTSSRTMTTTNTQNSTISSAKNNAWKIATGVVVPSVFLSVLLVYFFVFRKRRGYQRFGPQKRWHAYCPCCPCISSISQTKIINSSSRATDYNGI